MKAIKEISAREALLGVMDGKKIYKLTLTELTKSTTIEELADATALVTEINEKIDKGKVKALSDAGWSVDKIADEMSCHAVSVYRILKEA